MSKYLQKLEENAGLFEEAESRTISKHSSKNSSLISSKENKYPTKYEEPQYKSVKNTYEVLKPITKQIMELPPTHKKKIKTAKTIYQKEIIVNDEEELNKVLQEVNLTKEEIPLPSKSMIQNLLKDSIVISKDNYLIKPNNNNIINNNKNALYNSQRLKSTKNNLININNNSQQQNIEENMIKTQIIYNTNKLSTNQNIINNNKSMQGNYKNNIVMQSHNPKIKNEINNNNINNSQVFNNNNNNNNNNNKIKISYKNKNYIETFFHDDNIPKPNVVEGNALEFSDIKNPNKEINEEENNNIKNMLDELPMEHTVILSNQQKIDMSKIQKENMLQKSLSSDKSQMSNVQSINNNYIKYKSQNINFNNNNINNLTNSMKIKKYKQNIIKSEKPLPEIDMNENLINNNNTNIKNSTHIKIKPKMELQINKTNINNNINNININNSNINNKSKMSFPTSSHGGSFISQTSLPENPFQDNTSYNKENNNK